MNRGNSNEKIFIDILHNIFIINRNIKNSKIFAKTVFSFKVKREIFYYNSRRKN